MLIGVPREIHDGERRVALTPDTVRELTTKGIRVRVEAGAGAGAYLPDANYEAAGATLETDAARLYAEVDLLVKVRGPMPHPGGMHEVDMLEEGSALLGLLNPLGDRVRPVPGVGNSTGPAGCPSARTSRVRP